MCFVPLAGCLCSDESEELHFNIGLYYFLMAGNLSAWFCCCHKFCLPGGIFGDGLPYT